MIIIQRIISADIRSIIINTALVTVELIMTVNDDLVGVVGIVGVVGVVGLVGVDDFILELITEDAFPREK